MAIFMRDKKNEYLLRATLACTLRGLLGETTIIDLRNEAAIRGKVVDVDGYMNVELENCIFKTPRDEYYPMDNFFVSARNIRYVHVPPHTNSEELIRKGLYNERKTFGKVRQPANKKKTFKAKRAQLYQESIIKELQTMKK